MCVAPNTLSNGQVVACHRCWQCTERRINDCVGRCIAESKTATSTIAVTLTYGRNDANEVHHERSVLLTYSDVQKYFYLLRRHGFNVRYFIAGEYGERKGRAHWHGMLYFNGPLPEHVLDRDFMERHWPHGWSFWTKPTFKAMRYAAKYVQKDMGDDLRQGHVSFSKKPPLGSAYFEQLAERHVREHLSPQTLMYSFPEVARRKPDGSNERIEFMLFGRSAELYLDHFIRTWREVHGDKPWPASELVALYEEYGQVVSDEMRLIRTREFPRGESTAIFRMPSKAEMAGAKAQKDREAAAQRKVQWASAVDDWWDQWRKDAKGDEQEFKKRQAEFERYKRERADAASEHSERVFKQAAQRNARG